jgi:arsenate reductase
MKLLFLCTGNSCRSIIAEAIARQINTELWQVKSAGSQPEGYVLPAALQALESQGFSTENLSSKSWASLADYHPDSVITLCDRAAAQPCPIWLENCSTYHWSLPDPAAMGGAQQKQSLLKIIALIQHRMQGLAELLSRGAEQAEIDALLTSAIRFELPIAEC